MRLPDDVYATVVRLSAPYATTGTPNGYVMGSILNAIAWTHRADGWGLSRKTGGKRVDSPVGEIAEDILHHRPTNLLWDIWGGADVGQPLHVGNGPPHDIGPPESAARAWVAPVQPAGAVQPPVIVPPSPNPQPPPSTDLSAIKSQLASLRDVLQVLISSAATQGAAIEGLRSDLHHFVGHEILPHLDDVKRVTLGLEREERFR